MSPTERGLLVDRIRAEFLEMPGLRLTMRQAARLWGLELSDCHDVVSALEGSFLRRTAGGVLARIDAR